MSVPENLIIAVVCMDESKLIYLRRNAKFSNKGYRPDIHYVHPEKNIERIINPNKYPNCFVKMWVALDDDSLIFCKQEDKKNRKKKNYSRGYYDELLPEAILYIDAKLERKQLLKRFINIFDDAFKAFYETS